MRSICSWIFLFMSEVVQSLFISESLVDLRNFLGLFLFYGTRSAEMAASGPVGEVLRTIWSADRIPSERLEETLCQYRALRISI